MSVCVRLFGLVFLFCFVFVDFLCLSFTYPLPTSPRARAVEEGYVAEYREVEGGAASEEQPWMKKIVPVGATPPSLTSVTIEDLKPNTLYQVAFFSLQSVGFLKICGFILDWWDSLRSVGFFKIR